MRWGKRKHEILSVMDRALMTNEIAERVGLDPSHTRRCLNRLEEEGLVEKLQRDGGSGKIWISWKRRPHSRQTTTPPTRHHAQDSNR